MMKAAGQLAIAGPCNSTSLVLKIREKERYGESLQKAREGDKN